MPTTISKNLIAPCGMNCAICRAHLREHNPCHGCRDAEQNKPTTRVACRLRRCAQRRGIFCDCAEFPCDPLNHLDQRYRTRYGMSEIENLIYIRNHGVEKFLANERTKWVSERGTLCVHDRNYYK